MKYGIVIELRARNSLVLDSLTSSENIFQKLLHALLRFIF